MSRLPFRKDRSGGNQRDFLVTMAQESDLPHQLRHTGPVEMPRFRQEARSKLNHNSDLLSVAKQTMIPWRRPSLQGSVFALPCRLGHQANGSPPQELMSGENFSRSGLTRRKATC